MQSKALVLRVTGFNVHLRLDKCVGASFCSALQSDHCGYLTKLWFLLMFFRTLCLGFSSLWERPASHFQNGSKCTFIIQTLSSGLRLVCICKIVYIHTCMLWRSCSACLWSLRGDFALGRWIAFDLVILLWPVVDRGMFARCVYST